MDKFVGIPGLPVWISGKALKFRYKGLRPPRACPVGESDRGRRTSRALFFPAPLASSWRGGRGKREANVRRSLTRLPLSDSPATRGRGGLLRRPCAAGSGHLPAPASKLAGSGASYTGISGQAPEIHILVPWRRPFWEYIVTMRSLCSVMLIQRSGR